MQKRIQFRLRLIDSLAVAFFVIPCFYSCGKASNSIDSLKMECGLESTAVVDDSSVLKFVGPGEQSLDTKELSVLAILKNGDQRVVKPSSRGCVVFEHSFETLRVRTIINGEVLSRVLKSNEVNTSFSFVALSISQPATIELNCPANGIPAKNSFDLPLKLSTQTDLKKVGIQIYIRSLIDKKIKLVSEKPIGDESEKFVRTIDVSAFEPGDYQLELAITDLSQSLHEKYSLQLANSNCVLHKLPDMAVLSNENTLKFLKLGEVVVEQDIVNETFYCKIPFDQIKRREVCSLESDCSSKDKFQKSRAIQSDSTGKFRYIYYRQNELREETNLACQDISVSATPPKVTVQWKDPSLARPGASLDLPYVSLDLNINLSHEVRTNDELKKSLQCKAKFKLDKGIEIPANNIICESKECAGLNLSKPVPCGEELKINVKNAYDSPELWDAILEINVESDDGNGLKSSDSTGLWFHSSKWAVEKVSQKLDLMETESPNSAGKYLQGVGGDAVFYSGTLKERSSSRRGLVARLHGRETQLYQSPDALHTTLYYSSNVLNEDLYVLWEGGPSSCILMKYSSTSPSGIELPPPPGCVRFSIEAESQGYIWGISTKNDTSEFYYPFRFDGKKWDFFERISEYSPYCPAYLKLEVYASDYFSIKCDPLSIKIDYKGLKRISPANDFSKDFDSEKFEEEISKYPKKCDEKGIYAQNGEIYYPVQKILERSKLENSEILWNLKKCEDFASSGQSLFVMLNNELIRISFSGTAEFKPAHIPSANGWFAKVPLTDGGNAHPFFLSEKGHLFYLIDYRYVRIETPEELSKSFLKPRLTFSTYNLNAILFSTEGGIWLSNPSDNWNPVVINGEITLRPNWNYFDDHRCKNNVNLAQDSKSKNLALFPSDVYERVNLSCIFVQVSNDGDSIYNLKIGISDQSNLNWDDVWDYKVKCETEPQIVVNHYHETLEINCVAEVGKGSRQYLDLKTRRLLDSTPTGLIDIESISNKIFTPTQFNNLLPPEKF